MVVDGRVLLARELLTAPGAEKTFPVPGTVAIDDSTPCNRPFALGALLAKLFLVARYADDVLAARYKAIRSDQFLADFASETLGVPLSTLVLVLFHTCSKDVSAESASGCEAVLVARSAVEQVVLVGERLVDERSGAPGALEALVVPVFLLIRQILEVAGDRYLAFVAYVGKEIFVAFLAVGSFVVEDVTLSSQTDLAVQADELTALPVLFQRFREVG